MFFSAFVALSCLSVMFRFWMGESPNSKDES
jgi:hypothetical protein